MLVLSVFYLDEVNSVTTGMLGGAAIYCHFLLCDEYLIADIYQGL